MLGSKSRRRWTSPVHLFLMAGLLPASASGPTSPRLGPPLPGVARYEHQAVWDPVAGQAYVFGGLSRNASGDYGLLNELWSFSPATSKWVQLPSISGPSARTGSALAWDPIRRQVLVSSGSTVDAACSHDLWGYSVADSTWRALASEPNDPFVQRRYHTLTYDTDRDRFWQLSGFCIDEPYRNYTSYNVSTDAWSTLRFIGGAYGYRIKHGAVWDQARSRLLVYGGELPGYGPSKSQLLFWQIVWAFDPTQNSWTPLPTGTVFPSRRSSFISGYDPYLDALVVYGGITFASIPDPNPLVTGELWAYRLQTSDWVRLDEGDLPARAAAAGTYCASRGEILAFGGLDASPYAAGPGTIHSETVTVPVELPAVFRWAGVGAGGVPRGSRSGILDLQSVAGAIGQVRLMDAISGREYVAAQDIRRLGRARWRVTFGPASDAELRAEDGGQLLVSGFIDGQVRPFLAPIPARRLAPSNRLAGSGDATPSVGLPAQLDCRREAAGWAITVRGETREPSAVLVVDIRGRTWARLAAAPQRVRDEYEYHWSGQGPETGRAPRGVYFVRVIGRSVATPAKLVVE